MTTASNLQPAIDIIEQERRSLAALLAESVSLPVLSAVRRANGLQQLNERRLAAYSAALKLLGQAGLVADLVRDWAALTDCSSCPISADCDPQSRPAGADRFNHCVAQMLAALGLDMGGASRA